MNYKKIVPTQAKTNLIIGHTNVVEVIYPKRKSLYTQHDIKELVRIQQNRYQGKDITFMISANHQHIGWRSAKQFHVTSDPITNDQYEDDEEIDQFVIYVWQTPKKKGGDDNDKNDCLFYCILRILNSTMKKTWNNPYRFKKRLGLSRYDKVGIEKIPDIEKNLKININVCGDCNYTSSNTHSLTVNLILSNEHYKIVYNKSKKLLRQAGSNEESKLVMFYKDDDCYVTYDGDEYGKFDKISDMKDKNTTYKYMVNKKCNKDEIEQQYETYMKDVDKLKKATNGLINLAKSNFKVKDAVLKLFHNNTLGCEEPELITPLEATWIDEAFKGGLMFSEDDLTCDDAICYDKNSAYPSTLNSTSFSIPIKQGVFSKIEELPEVLGYGIYRVVIKKSNDKHTNKLFRFNEYDKYTHLDINTARKIGLSIKLIVDDQSNCLLYNKRLNGTTFFRSTIDYLYDLKLKKVPFAKDLLSQLWGALCQKRIVKRILKGKPYALPDECEVERIKRHDDTHKVEYVTKKNIYHLPYARFGPFLTAHVRRQLALLMLPYKDDVIRCHTDSILSTCEIKELKLSSNMGEWKIENKGKCYVNKMNKVKFLD